jgi:AraC-like DNA-binding protein
MAESISDFATATPSPGLRPYVDGYMGYKLAGFPPGLHRGLPGRRITFIVSIGPQIDVVQQTNPVQAPDSYRCVFGGLQATTAVISHTGYQEGVSIELSPLGCRRLLGLPAAALWDTSAEFADVVGPVGDELWERLQGTTTWRERFTICDQILERVACEAIMAPELRRVWSTIVTSGGNVGIRELAYDIGWSRQHLTRRFTSEFGLGPKLAGRVVRFDRARHMLQRTPSYVSIAQVAAACGYYDQAHLDRDFAEMAGCSPTTWLQEELPSVQDDDGLDASSSDV